MIPVVDLTRIVEWVKNVGADIIKWIALRTLLLAIVTTLVPMAIYHGWLLIQEQLFTFLQGQMSGDLWSGTIIQLTGIGAWLAEQLKFQESFMVLASALSFRFVLGFFRR
ncbi:MAG: hypothetical protein MI862_21380 [Desulfobacterales bacterium]|nr:hypothetical protein [Desulfobacterales bacterium]